jgi:surfactin synthase thioesterase subunit
MGARVGLSLAYALRAAGLPLPARLFVAGSAAPAVRAPVGGWDQPDDGLIAYLRELGGTPAGVLDHPDLRELFLPVVRADLTVIGTCPTPDRPPLPVPITAFAGADDLAAPPALMRPWSAETSAACTLHVLPGGHFLTPASIRRALDLTALDLLGTAATPATDPCATASRGGGLGGTGAGAGTAAAPAVRPRPRRGGGPGRRAG